VLGAAAVVVSLFGYFFYIVAAFTTIMALLIAVFNQLTSEKARHYPHPIIEPTVTAVNTEPRQPPVALGTKEGAPAIYLLAKDTNTDSRAVPIARADAEKPRPERKIKPERPAHLHQPNVLARQRQNYDGHGYAMAVGYTRGYRPGLARTRWSAIILHSGSSPGASVRVTE
jgi:hypothetical protein